ncbi:hypothetical protein FVEG_11165 [Fusarium verticillioides 7600]|uniref:Uncharacterized protein n=1 Tax=Gibberella moniliformis (strain M3125 / FGSC 7600) TaxID=334819 RepID=W7MX73_GIBM7|nr:hypothetical protein FVEG_11165 [Fusarium verticillioides 7600]EWG52404.1 hypothetical protein FVEG_11165 [Fusarium verticillioides 7600]
MDQYGCLRSPMSSVLVTMIGDDCCTTLRYSDIFQQHELRVSRTDDRSRSNVAWQLHHCSFGHT